MANCVIIPCFNEEKRINLDSFNLFFQKVNDCDFIFVNDGSSDHTLKILEEYKANHLERVDVLNLRANSGKAQAVRLGVQFALEKGYDLVGYFDADLATPLSEIPLFFEVFKTHAKIKYVMGTRLTRLGAEVYRKISRHYIGRVFATLASMLLRMPVYDTQCGAKMIKSDLASEIFKDEFISKWFFDVELLFRIKKSNAYKQEKNIIFEKPLLAWKEIYGSKLKKSDFLFAPLELFKIYFKYR